MTAAEQRQQYEDELSAFVAAYSAEHIRCTQALADARQRLLAWDPDGDESYAVLAHECDLAEHAAETLIADWERKRPAYVLDPRYADRPLSGYASGLEVLIDPTTVGTVTMEVDEWRKLETEARRAGGRCE